MRSLGIVVGVLGAIALVVAVGVAGWHFGWWLQEKNTDRRVGIENRNLGTQTAWRDEALDLINQADLLPPEAPQRQALEDQACDLIGRLTDNYKTDDRLLSFEARECV